MPVSNVQLVTPDELGIRFISMSGRDSLSDLYHYELEFVDTGKTIEKEELLGKTMAIQLPLTSDKDRYFHGYVARLERTVFGTHHSARYHVTIVPWLWLATKTNNCRIFQDKSVPEIVEEVFSQEAYTKIKQIRNSLTKDYPKRIYCVQYRESDFAFVSRLLEEEGIAYYFSHERTKHTLILVDSISGFPRMEYRDTVEYLPVGRQQGAVGDFLDELHLFDAIESGEVALSDSNFEEHPMPQRAQVKGSDAGHDLSEYQWYDHPGNFLTESAGRARAELRMAEREALRTRIEGGHGARGMIPGALFKITGASDIFPREDLLITRVDYQIGDYGEVEDRPGAVECRTSFIAIPCVGPYRPPCRTPRPIVSGLQTAVVTGPTDKEVHTDQYGRVKVQFHWDREGKLDAESSCWLRVAFPWADKRFGFVTIPRIGQEVVISFLEGDPDRPMVVGCVYNAEHKPPWTLTDFEHFSGIRSHTIQGSESDFNEFRFSDKKEEELVYVHAQRDYEARVKHDRKEYVGRDADCKVLGDRRDAVVGKFHLKVDGERLTKVGTNDGLDINADYNIKTGTAFSVKAGSDFQVKASANTAMETGSQLHLKAATIIIEAATMLTIKAGASSIVLGPAGVSVDGAPLVQLNCGGTPGAGMGAQPSSPGTAELAQDASEPVS